MKIGILGGSFDPIHKAHVYMAQCAKDAYELDEVWLIPAGHSPNKDENKMRSAEDRLAMTVLAAESLEGICACDIEVISEERSYTYRTLEKLTESYPEHEFYFIMGGDSLDYFDKWYHPEIIASLAVILVIVRKDFPVADMEAKIEKLQKLFPCDIRLASCPQYDLSSTMIRNNIEDRDFCLKHLDEKVYNYIIEHHLYGLGEQPL